MKCPVCGMGHLEKKENGWQCGNESCGFTIPSTLFDVEITEEMVDKLLRDGRTDLLDMKNREGAPFKASLVLRHGRITVQSNMHYLNGVCPVCGGRMRVTLKGYRCENSIGEHPTCEFMIPSIVCNRRITEEEATEFLAKQTLALDGFATNEHKAFSSTITLSEDGKVVLQSRIAKCPLCGGDIHIGQRAYNCSNYRNEAAPCKFSIWRNIGGHAVTAEEAREICEEGATKKTLEFFREDGTVYYKKLALSQQKDRVSMI
jgi:hypothetical protein